MTYRTGFDGSQARAIFGRRFARRWKGLLTMRITEQSRQALHILLALARATPNAATASQVAEAVSLPETTIFKVLKTLTRAGLVATVRGRGGGIWLARPAERIALGEVLRACEPRFVQCGPAARLLPTPQPPDLGDSAIERALGACIAAFLREADKVTLASLNRADASDSRLIRRA
jgi:Rrf2 family nitric oxide-sensitive transcriptional repressor